VPAGIPGGEEEWQQGRGEEERFVRHVEQGLDQAVAAQLAGEIEAEAIGEEADQPRFHREQGQCGEAGDGEEIVGEQPRAAARDEPDGAVEKPGEADLGEDQSEDECDGLVRRLQREEMAEAPGEESPAAKLDQPFGNEGGDDG
jgi:hypothetical protein